MKHRSIFLLVALAVLGLALLAGCAARDTGAKDTTGSKADEAAASSNATEDAGIAYKEASMHQSPVQVTGTETAVIETSKGTIVLEFYPNEAPNTVASFIELAESGFYNGIKFHRVVSNFVVQAGDPQTRDLTPEQVIAGVPGIGSGGPGWNQKAEFNQHTHDTGTLAMARTPYDVDSAGSQFYICLSPQPQLDGQYTVFGHVTEGMDVVSQIAVGDVIESVTIRR